MYFCCMKKIIKEFIKLNIIHLPNLGAIIYPDKPKNQAGAKLRNKVKELQGNKLTDKDWALIEDKLHLNKLIMKSTKELKKEIELLKRDLIESRKESISLLIENDNLKNQIETLKKCS